MLKYSFSLSYPVIIDGKIYGNALTKLGLSNEWRTSSLRLLIAKTNSMCLLKPIIEDKKNIIPIVKHNYSRSP